MAKKPTLNDIMYAFPRPELPKAINIPRVHQVVGKDAIQRGGGNFIVGDKMGVGKTGEVLEWWKSKNFAGPTILIGGTNALSQWIEKSKEWGAPTPFQIKTRYSSTRQQQWQQLAEKKIPYGFVCITMNALKIDLAKGYVPKELFLVIRDEAHKDANRKSDNYRAMKQLRGMARYVIPVTGNPIPRGELGRAWGLLNIIRPKQFPSYWNFISAWNHMQTDEFGHREILAPKNVPELKKYLANFMISRRKEDVMQWLPPKTREFVPVELGLGQKKLITQLTEEGIAELTGSDDLAIAPNILTRILRIRQVLAAPQLVDPKAGDLGGAVSHLMERLEESEEPHMVVLTPFKKAFPYIQQAINNLIPHQPIIPFQGGMSPELLSERLKTFRDTKATALCTIAFAESFDFVPASWCYFVGWEWDPDVNEQAEDRLHRANTTVPISCYYPKYEGMIDSLLMLPILNRKARGINTILKDLDTYRDMLMEVKSNLKNM